MLSDTMKQVNKAEKKAKKILQNAKEKSLEIVETAREQAKQDLETAERNAKDEAKAALAQAEQEGEEAKKIYASEVKHQLESLKAQALAKADAAVDAILAGLV